MNLRLSLALILMCANVAAMFLVGVLLLSVWAALLIVFNALATLVQLLAVMILLGIKLSAIPAVILVLSVGFSVCFTVHVSLVSFLEANLKQSFVFPISNSFSLSIHRAL